MFASEEVEERFRVMGREVPVVLRYADELNLKCVTTSSGRSVRGQGAPLSAVLSLFRHIRVLRIIDANFTNCNVPASCLRLQFPTLETLTLSKTSFRSAHDVLRVASQFKELRTLRVEDVTITGTSSHSSSNNNNNEWNAEAEQSPSFNAPTIRNLHILNCTKSPALASLLSTSLSYHSHSNTLKTLHVDTTSHTSMLSALKNAEVESGVGVEELHLTLTEELYPLWHVHAQGTVSNMTAPDVRAGKPPLPSNLPFSPLSSRSPRFSSHHETHLGFPVMKPVLNCRGLQVLRLSVQRSPIVRMVQTMEGLGCQGGVLCSAWEVYREALFGLFSTSSSSSNSGMSASTDTEADATASTDARFECRELHLSFDARDIGGPKAHISAFESTLGSCFLSSPSHAHPNPTSVKTIKFLIKEFIDPVLPDEPARLRGLWDAFVERLQARLQSRFRLRERVRGDGRDRGRVEVEVDVGVEFFDRRDFDV